MVVRRYPIPRSLYWKCTAMSNATISKGTSKSYWCIKPYIWFWDLGWWHRCHTFDITSRLRPLYAADKTLLMCLVSSTMPSKHASVHLRQYFFHLVAGDCNIYTVPENSSAGVCQSILASFSQLPAYWCPWLLPTAIRKIRNSWNVSGFSFSLVSRNLRHTLRRLLSCSWSVRPMTVVSSRPSKVRPVRTGSMSRSKVAGALHSPKDMTLNCHSPRPLENAPTWSILGLRAYLRYKLSFGFLNAEDGTK